jgi:hypothetical protein
MLLARGESRAMSSIRIDDLNAAVDDLATIPFFPNESRASVMNFLAKICPHRKALVWLAAEATNRVRTWPGLAEIRGLLCTKYDAADGIDGYCALPGYTPGEMEAKHFEQHEQIKAGSWEADRLRHLGVGSGRELREIEDGK